MYNWFDIDNNPPKITDWLQGIGALIAIIAAIVGFIKLFKRDKNKEKEIRSLAGIAEAQQDNLLKLQLLLEESQKQTQEFVIQSSEMRESNALYKKHLDILTESVADNKIHQGKLLEIKQSERKNEILPRFKFYSSEEREQNFNVQLQLVRSTAYFEGIHSDPESGFSFRSDLSTVRAIGTNEVVTLNGSITQSTHHIHDYLRSAPVKFEFLVRNEDKNLYRQVIERVNSKFEISQPEEVIEGSPTT